MVAQNYMESEDLDDTSIKRNSYYSSQKRKSKSTSDEVMNYNNNDTIITNPADSLVATSKEKGKFKYMKTIVFQIEF